MIAHPDFLQAMWGTMGNLSLGWGGYTACEEQFYYTSVSQIQNNEIILLVSLQLCVF
jgi:hypothetical protein